MSQMRELRSEEVSEVSGGMIAVLIGLAIGVAGLAVAEFSLGYSIGKDLAANDAK